MNRNYSFLNMTMVTLLFGVVGYMFLRNEPVMARVRDWPLELQAALRLSLMAQTNPWANAPTTALRCGALVWARVRRDDAGPLGPVTFWFDFATGDWGYPHDDHDQPLSCRLRAGDRDPGIRRLASSSRRRAAAPGHSLDRSR